MKHSVFLPGFFLCLLTVSCTRETSQSVPPFEDQSTFVSMSQAEAEVLKLLSVVDGEVKGPATKRRIVEKYSLGGPDSVTKSDGIEDPLVYVFNFNDNQGYAIASGDNRMPPVFCLVDKGHLSDTTSLPEGAIAMLSRIDTEYRMTVGLPITDYYGNTVTAEQYSEYGVNMIRPEDDETTYTLITLWHNGPIMGSLLSCRWEQTGPFNKYCKTSDGKDAYVGCVAVAVGQVMYHWGHNTTYNGHYYDWNDMHRITSSVIPSIPFYANAWEQVQLLLRDLGRSENLDMDYGEIDNSDGSGAYCENIQRTFLNFGYSNGGDLGNLNEATLKYNILNGPVIGCGYSHEEVNSFLGITISTTHDGGHEWVYDQYMEQTRYRNVYNRKTGELIRSEPEVKTLVRCNWGWGDTCDGFYLFGDYNTNNRPITKTSSNSSEAPYYYQYELRMHTGIHP